MGKIQQIRDLCVRMDCYVRQNEPMCNHTTFKIGGPAELFLRPSNRVMAATILHKLDELCMPVTIIGRGSNLLVSDQGVEGVVLCLDEEDKTPVLQDDDLIRCPAGVSLAKLCAFACSEGLSGLEFAWGIPGSVGGAIFMNAGAYGGEIKDRVVQVEYLDSHGAQHTKENEALEFSYRRSWFMTNPGNLITDALFRLRPGNRVEIRQTMDDYMAKRKENQPLEYPSAGSTFKRPLGGYASQLIDQCGLKGRQIGGAMVSKKHAGFILNVEDATCEDVCLLIQEVQREVQRQTGFMLKCEVQRLGKMLRIS